MTAAHTAGERDGVPTAIMTGLGAFGSLAALLVALHRPAFASIQTASLVIAVTFAVLFTVTLVLTSIGAARRALAVSDTIMGVWPMGFVGTIAAPVAPLVVLALPSAAPVALVIIGVAWVFHATQALRRSPSV